MARAVHGDGAENDNGCIGCDRQPNHFFSGRLGSDSVCSPLGPSRTVAVMYDVIIIGGGPAGLNAALVLGRCRRSVLVCDHGMPRNAHAHAMHGFLSRDGINPHELLGMGRDQLKPYGVEIVKAEVVDAARSRNSFSIKLHDGKRYRSRKLLLATGLRDQLPRLEGLTELYGTSVHHCPYCDGWEWRDKALAAYGHGKAGLGLALMLKRWSDDVVVLTDGVSVSLNRYRESIKRNNLRVHNQKITRLQGRNGKLKSIIFEDGSAIERQALFFNTDQRQKSDLPEKLGCKFNRNGGVIIDRRERTCVPGLFLAGDASKEVQFVICAAAEGAIAAVAINRELQQEERRTL